MPVDNDTLTGWSAIGAQATSRDTYATIRRCLEGNAVAYRGRPINIFLQGSYGNDTNIFRESDVDIIIRLDDLFYYDVAAFNTQRQVEFREANPPSTYTLDRFKDDVLNALRHCYGADIALGSKAITVAARGNRRQADVIVAAPHRKFLAGLVAPLQPIEGICFFKTDGTQVVNYPRQHQENLTFKNQQTNQWAKPVVRILKNAREQLIRRDLLQREQAPSYFVESLVFNVPNELFGVSYQSSVRNCITWLLAADRTMFTTASGQHPLFSNSANAWRATDCHIFLNGIVDLWNHW